MIFHNAVVGDSCSLVLDDNNLCRLCSFLSAYPLLECFDESLPKYKKTACFGVTVSHSFSEGSSKRSFPDDGRNSIENSLFASPYQLIGS